MKRARALPTTSPARRITHRTRRGCVGAAPGRKTVASAGSIPAPSAALAEYDLDCCVVTRPSGRVEIRRFQNPHDAEGVTWHLSPRMRELLAHALAVPGFHVITRDDAPDLQTRLPL